MLRIDADGTLALRYEGVVGTTKLAERTTAKETEDAVRTAVSDVRSRGAEVFVRLLSKEPLRWAVRQQPAGMKLPDDWWVELPPPVLPKRLRLNG